MLEIFDNGGGAHFKNIIIIFLNKVAKSIEKQMLYLNKTVNSL
ncbi:MAG: hypothetical protein SOU07_03220 [Bacilli bacterium]|nr:hypothetical protein [Bacilli bacterium]